MKKFFSQLALAMGFRKPTAEELVELELQNYKRELIRAESAKVYQEKMAEFYREGIRQLKRIQEQAA